MANQTMLNIEPFVDSTPLLKSPEELRARAAERGYLFFRGLLDEASVLDLRRQILAVCQKQGWLDDDAPLTDGISRDGSLFIEGHSPEWIGFYTDVQRLRAFNALALHPAIIGMLETLFGEKVLPHPRNICRVIFPNAQTHTTPPHQDNFYIGGTDETWTAWIPAGDCPAALGSLAVAPGSHKLGKLEVEKAIGAGGHAVLLGQETLWAGGDFACGDVLICHSLTAHQGQDNESGDRLRISLDYRYQPMSHPVRSDSLEPHMHFTDWENIYSGWDADDPLKYYWEEWDLEINQREG
ncbi:MAG: phytanoyl-CoA dioxygenase family protein [Candidatus Latescibacterota bacterium]|nr:phytanoyl-CoA dioxygenase family protein [Candidatus Latescibacterota bacterium]